MNQVLDAVAGHCSFWCYELEVVLAPERISCKCGLQAAQVEDERRECRSIERERVVDIRKETCGVKKANGEFGFESVSDDAARAATCVRPVAFAIEEALQPKVGGARGCGVSEFVVGRVVRSGVVAGCRLGLVEEFDDRHQECVQDITVQNVLGGMRRVIMVFAESGFAIRFDNFKNSAIKSDVLIIVVFSQMIAKNRKSAALGETLQILGLYFERRPMG